MQLCSQNGQSQVETRCLSDTFIFMLSFWENCSFICAASDPRNTSMRSVYILRRSSCWRCISGELGRSSQHLVPGTDFIFCNSTPLAVNGWECPLTVNVSARLNTVKVIRSLSVNLYSQTTMAVKLMFRLVGDLIASSSVSAVYGGVVVHFDVYTAIGKVGNFHRLQNLSCN